MQPNHLQSFVNSIKALERTHAILEFDAKGIVLTANQKFLDALGYELSEIAGKPHAAFVDPKFGLLGADNLRRERPKLGKLIGKAATEIWVEASCMPVVDDAGRYAKTVLYCTLLRSSDEQSEIDQDIKPTVADGAGARSDFDADVIAFAQYRMLCGEAHRVLRCLEAILVTDRHKAVDTGRIADLLGVKSQAVSRALKTLIARSIIQRGDRVGRSFSYKLVQFGENPRTIGPISRLDPNSPHDVARILSFLDRQDPGFDFGDFGKHAKSGFTLYALSDGAVQACALGFFNRTIDSGPTIEHLVVSSAIRGTGLGTSFLRKIEEYFGEKYLFVNVKKSDRETVIALLKLGFDIVGQILTNGEIVSTIILRKTCGS